MIDDVPADVLDRLVSCTAPHLIGVRHHSAAIAKVLPELLGNIRPGTILLEMPPDFAHWLPYLSDDQLETPVALAASGSHRLLSFYPLADFSPELIAVRWAAANNVPIIPCDLRVEQMSRIDDQDHESPNQLVNRLLERHDVPDTGELWEKLVESPAIRSSPEGIRRAALYFGWVMRYSHGGPTDSDRHREHAMRQAIEQAPQNSVAIVGAFHAAALLPDPVLWTPPGPIPVSSDSASSDEQMTSDVATSLVPYSFEQLDQRSGYPAGILDPVWQQTMLSATSAADAAGRLATLAVQLCRKLRREGHVAGTPDATEIVRIAQDLGTLRGYAAPGRREFLDAIESSLVQGDLFGRGRAVAAAAHSIFVGDRRGRLPANTPRSGLAQQVEKTVARLRMPDPESENKLRELRLDPLRSSLDRARAVTLRRLNLLGVVYGRRRDTEGIGDRENLTELWSVQWNHTTSATLAAAATKGVSLEQACEAVVRQLENQVLSIDQPHPATTISQLTAASECGLPSVVLELLSRLRGSFMEMASMSQLIEASSILQRIAAGHVVGLPIAAEDRVPPDVDLFPAERGQLNLLPLLDVAIRRLPGMHGSDDLADVRTLVDLAAFIRPNPNVERSDVTSLFPALRSRLVRMRRQASPMMQAAAWGTLALLAVVDFYRIEKLLAGWYDAASTADGRRGLRLRLSGLISAIQSLILAEPAWLDGIEHRLRTSDDTSFLTRLPALRGGFKSMPPADRVQLLRCKIQLLEPGGPTRSVASGGGGRVFDAVLFARASVADRAGASEIAQYFPNLIMANKTETSTGDKTDDLSDSKLTEPIESKDKEAVDGEISLVDRWRLILGVEGCSGTTAKRAATSLDQLYGQSINEGRGYSDDLTGGGGTDAAQPTVREWVGELDGLFGKDVCEEVAAEVATQGRPAVLEYLDAETVNPSVELLEQVLSLKGALPERELAAMRKLAKRITDKLAARLADQLRPALSGLSTPRPTYRPSPRLDFHRTIQKNLKTAYRRSDQTISLVPERVVFRSPAKRQMDWHIIFVVDVSGSMEPSVIYSSLVAAIVSALPAIDVKFFAFSTSVIDLSENVDDPLSLLMEVQVGGGTHIGLGLRAAREAIKKPARTLVIVVSDFEEGVSVPEMLAEVRMIADSGAKPIGLAALDRQAVPRFHTGNAGAVAAAGMPVAAVSPERLAQWIGDQIRGASSLTTYPLRYPQN